MKIGVLKLRQSLGRVLDKVKRSGEPVIIEKGHESIAVLISMKSYQERFVDLQERKSRERLLRKFRESAVKASEDSLKVLRELRYGSSD